MNEIITCSVLQAAIDAGVRDFIICPGGRNASFVDVLREERRVSTYYWPEERSAAFFALGRARLRRRPAAVVTTSGTAAGELLPAAMEAYYSGVPLLLITADRPRRFRGSGAPQAAQQAGLFGEYARFSIDIHGITTCDLSKWQQQGPAHLNVCLEEPQGQPSYSGKALSIGPCDVFEKHYNDEQAASMLDRFLEQIKRPLVIVSTLDIHEREETVKFLLKLGAPVLLEGISGLREDPRLQQQRIRRTDGILEAAAESGYIVDGVLRIGGVPTHRIWRDIENLKGRIKVCSLGELPFSGLSWNRNIARVAVGNFLKTYYISACFHSDAAGRWLQSELGFEKQLLSLFAEEPSAEPALLRSLSQAFPDNSHVYLGNSLPIREWDLAADEKSRGFEVTANRGLNGIDGQIATFLGLCQEKRENWAIVGDLTALYDMAGLWVLPQLAAASASIAIINNGGGKLFERLFPHPEMLNRHALSFEPLAKLWGLQYDFWKGSPRAISNEERRLIEIVPDEAATKRFWKKAACIGANALLSTAATRE